MSYKLILLIAIVFTIGLFPIFKYVLNKKSGTQMILFSIELTFLGWIVSKNVTENDYLSYTLGGILIVIGVVIGAFGFLFKNDLKE